MPPIIQVSKETLGVLNPNSYVIRDDLEHKPRSDLESQSDNNFIYVPSLNIQVARERTHFGLNQDETHEALREEGLRMPTIPEFAEFLIYTRDNVPEVYEDITAVRNPWRAERLDAYFEQRKNGMYVLTENRTKAEKLDEDTLMKDRTPGISLDFWIGNPTKQGLPREDVKRGNLYFWHPKDGMVAWFDADDGRVDLFCDMNPSNRDSDLGVRAVKK